MSLQEREFFRPDWFWDHPVFSDDIFNPVVSQTQDGKITTVLVDMQAEEDIYVIGHSLLQELEEHGIPNSLPTHFIETSVEDQKVYYVTLNVFNQQPPLTRWSDGWSWVLFDHYMQNYGKLYEAEQLEDVLFWLVGEMGDYARNQLGFEGYGSRRVLENFVSSLKLYSFGTEEERALRLPSTLMPDQQMQAILEQHSWKV